MLEVHNLGAGSYELLMNVDVMVPVIVAPAGLSIWSPSGMGFDSVGVFSAVGPLVQIQDESGFDDDTLLVLTNAPFGMTAAIPFAENYSVAIT